VLQKTPMNRVYKMSKVKGNSKRINNGENVTLKYNLDLPEPEKLYWSRQLTEFHR
jgi:hypothetical protein